MTLLICFLEFPFRCRCDDRPVLQKKCYNIGFDTFCFFRPEPDYKRVTWQEALQTCRRKNATLPSFPSEAAQSAFQSYMDFLNLVDRDDFWMAGQEIREQEWKWLNGKKGNLTRRQFEGRPTLNLTPCSNNLAQRKPTQLPKERFTFWHPLPMHFPRVVYM